MKKINRNTPPQEYVNLISGSSRPQNWDEFVKSYSDIYHALRNQLLSEQQDTSGYTERHLAQNGNIHIDHFRRKGIFGDEVTFDHNNFVVDERDCPSYGAGYKDTRVKREDYDWLINPMEEDPQDFFTYMADGTMIPRRDIAPDQQDRAQKTIDMFNLNHEYLRHTRQGLIKMLEAYKLGQMTKADAEEDFARGIGFLSLVDFVF